MSVQESTLPRQGIEGLYAEHHGWLRGWLRGRLGNAFDAADLAHDTYLRILSSGRMPEPRQSRQHLAQIAKGLVIDLYRRRQIEAAYLDALARLPQRWRRPPRTGARPVRGPARRRCCDWTMLAKRPAARAKPCCCASWTA